jgi:4-amino-4-deoxy-L-arabinose transferase-like glycosyltransferase
VFILNLWGYPLFDVDEPRYAETAREMLTSPGDWITPHFNWMVRFDKPVLFYWLIAFSYKIFGVSAFSARLVSALAATCVMLMLYALVRYHSNRWYALLTAVIFATMIEVYALGRWSVTDMTLASCMAGTWISLFLVLSKSPKWYLAAGFFGALGMLTKGPVAIALPGLTFLIAIGLYYRSHWKKLLSPWALAGFTLFMALVLPWYVAVAQANPIEFVGKFFFFHNVERFTGTVSGHSGPWYYYIPVLVGGAFPWIIFAPGMVAHWLRERKTLPDFVRYAWLWFWVVFLFFSAAGTKLLTYILPGLPALAILIGWHLTRQIELAPETHTESHLKKDSAWITHGLLWLCSGLLVIACYISWSDPLLFIPTALRGLYAPLYTQILLFILLGTFLLTSILMRYPVKRAISVGVFSLGLILTLTYANLFLMPEVAGLLQHDIMAFAQRAVKDNMPIATYRFKKPSLVFYTQKKVYFIPEIIDSSTSVTIHSKKLHDEAQSLYLVVKNKDLATLANKHPFTPIQSGKVYSLVKFHHTLRNQEINQ